MTSLKRRRQSPSSSTEPSPLLPFATNNHSSNTSNSNTESIRSSSVSAPVPRRASAPVSGQISTDPIYPPYIWRDYSPIYPPPTSVKRQKIMVPSSPYPSTSGQDYVSYSTAPYDQSGLSSLPTPTPTIAAGYASAYSNSVSFYPPSEGCDSDARQPMPPASGMGGYPTPSTTYAQTPSNYASQVSPISPYGQTAYYGTGTTMGLGFDPPPSEQQIAKAKRQQQNRDAQKRFREKKKATQADMETRLEELEDQLKESAEEIDSLRAENERFRMMLGMPSQLEQQVTAAAIASGRPVGKQSRSGTSGRLATQSP